MTDYSDIFGREPEPWREPLGALRLTLADENGPSWRVERARAECEALVRVLNEHPPADQGKPQVTDDRRPQRLSPRLRASLIDFAKDRIQAVWNDVGETDAATLAENVVSAQEWAWMSAQVPIVTDERVDAGARVLAGLSVDLWAKERDTPSGQYYADQARAVLEAALGGAS